MIGLVAESCSAAAGFVCITREVQLICQLSTCNFDTTGMIAFSNQIRQSSLNLMFSEKPESAAAMVGIAKEAISMRDYMSNERTLKEPDLYEQYMFCENIRKATATILTMLDDDFCIETAGNCTPSVESEKPMGVWSE